MLEFDDADDLMEFCLTAWSADADPDLLEALASSLYGLGDLGLDEQEAMEDEGFLTELFQGHSGIYEVMGEMRTHFESGFPLFRVIAAAHPNTPGSALDVLTNDGDAEVLWALAGNTSAGAALLERLSACVVVLPTGIEGRIEPSLDSDPANPTGVRYGTFARASWDLDDVPIAASVAGNRACPIEVLETFARSSEPLLARAIVLRNGDRLSDTCWHSLLEGALACEDAQRGWLVWMAVSPHLPTSLYPRILADPEAGVLLARCIAAAPRSTPESLALVAQSGPDAWTIERIACHPNANAEVRSLMAGHEA